MGFSLSHVLLVLVVVLIVFGAGKLPRVMADLGKGLRAFKDGLWDEAEKTPESVDVSTVSSVSSSAQDKKS